MKAQLVPIMKVVNAAIIDTGADVGAAKETYLHWCARGFKDLNRQTLKMGKRYALLPVNKNTHTATLPVDFSRELFVGVMDARGIKVPLKSNTNLADRHSVQIVEETEKCSVCSQPKSVCQDLEITETSNPIVLNGTTYEQKIIKRLYPNGDYYLETTTPYFDYASSSVLYNTDKEFIDHLDLKPCGCLADTETNLSTLRRYSPDVYSCYYAPCNCDCDPELGSYKIFEETNRIQLDYNFQFDKIYIEYEGALPKVNGQLQIPEVAFETLVELTIFKSMKSRKNVSNPDKNMQWQVYTNARRNMEKVLAQVSLSAIIDIALRVPKFNTTYRNDWYSCFDWNAQASNAVSYADARSNNSGGNGTGGNTGGGTGGQTTVVITNNIENQAPPSIIANGLSFSSIGSIQLPEKYKGLDFLIFWNGLRYLTRNEYIVDSVNAILTITLGDKPFTSEDNYILIPNGKI